ATDAPFLPADLVARLADELGAADADLACAASAGRAHPVFGLWPVRLREDLRRAVLDEGVRKVDQWTSRHKIVTVPFPDAPFHAKSGYCGHSGRAIFAAAGPRPPATGRLCRHAHPGTADRSTVP